jgi:O-antigen/teichoic acid export membrane protein
MPVQPLSSDISTEKDAGLGPSLAEVKSGALRVFASNWLVLVVRSATTVLVVRTVGAEAKGIQAYVVAWAAIFSIIVSLGFSTGISFWINSGAVSLAALRRRMLGQCLCVAGLLVLFYPLILPILPKLQSQSLPIRTINLWMLAMVPMLLLNEQMTSLALAMGRIRSYSMQVNAEAIGFGVTCVAFLCAHRLQASTVLVSTIAGYIAATIVGWGGLMSAPQSEAIRTEQSLKSMYGFALQGYPAALLNGLQKRLDVLIIGPALGATQLAYYAVGAQGYQALMSLPRALTGLLTRSVCKAGASGAEVLAFSITKRAMTYMSAIALVGSFVGFWAIPLLYGNLFKAAISPFIVLIWASVFTGGTTCLQTLCFGRGKPGAASVNVVVTTAVKLLLLLVFVARFGILGCAMATLLSAVFGMIFQLKQVRTLGPK